MRKEEKTENKAHRFLHPRPYIWKRQSLVLELLSQSLRGCYLCDGTQICFLLWISDSSLVRWVDWNRLVIPQGKIPQNCLWLQELFDKKMRSRLNGRGLVLSPWFWKSNTFIYWYIGCIDIPYNIVWGRGEKREGKKENLKTRQLSLVLKYFNYNLLNWMKPLGVYTKQCRVS